MVEHGEHTSSGWLTGAQWQGTPRRESADLRIFDMRDSGQYTAIAALSVLMIGALVILVSVLQRVGGRSVREA